MLAHDPHPQPLSRRERGAERWQVARYLREETLRARQLRRTPTAAEQALWELLRSRRVGGAKFRRQQPLGRYIADFYCYEASLVVEADGAPHFPPPPAQLVRDALLRVCGLQVLRFENSEILERPEAVVAAIERAIVERRTPPLPPGEGAGG